jgi:hypothetical protein
MAGRPRNSKPQDYTYEDIDEYFYNSDKIMMTNLVVFDIKHLTHLPRAIEYANADNLKRAQIIKEEQKPKVEGEVGYKESVKYDLGGATIEFNPKMSYEEFAAAMKKFGVVGGGGGGKGLPKKTSGYSVNPDNIRDKIKKTRPKSPLKNRLKQMGL